MFSKKIISPPEIWDRSKLYLMRDLLVWLKKWISILQLVPVLFRVFRSPYCSANSKIFVKLLLKVLQLLRRKCWLYIDISKQQYFRVFTDKDDNFVSSSVHLGNQLKIEKA